MRITGYPSTEYGYAKRLSGVEIIYILMFKTEKS
jgi:hypothetical protein